MINRPPLLIELFTEELPPQAERAMAESFATSIATRLRALGLLDADTPVHSFASPRHLAMRADAVRPRSDSRTVRLKGPSLKAGLDEHGKPTMALVKWAQKQDVPMADLRQEGEGKQAHFCADKTLPGEPLSAVINDVLEQAITALPIPRLMRYQLADGLTTVSFARPAHRLVVLHGTDVVPACVLGLTAGRITFGHRFLSRGPVNIASADQYEATLSAAHVEVSFQARRARIVQALRAAAQAERRSIADDAGVTALIDEVTAIVEWPAVYVGGFDARYLEVPPECLILTMQTHQRYFPLFDANGSLSNRFLIVSNMAIDDPRRIVAGNERVVVPRLADAQFFYAQDRRQSLDSRRPRLASVVYHARLGSQAERTARVRTLTLAIATQLNLDPSVLEHAARAADLAKTDLLTDMVGEFPELQGIMGEYYARHDGEAAAVATAIREQYQPRFAGDALPASLIGTVLAMADKLETVAGLFSIGQLPTGDRDPFALRRHTLGIIRMLIEKPLGLPLPGLLAACREVFQINDDTMGLLTDFFHERLTGYLRDQGHASGSIAAVTALRPAVFAQVPARLAAVSEFARLPQAQALAAANKRIGNILRKAEAVASDDAGPDPALFTEAAERALADAVAAIDVPVRSALAAGQYTLAMTRLAEVREPVDHFFDQVMVMAQDPAIRHNRLKLLARLHAMMNQVADISGLAAA